MDTFVFPNGRCVLSDLETRLEKEESEDCRNVFSRSTGAEFHLVTNFLWIKGTIARAYHNCGNVGTNCNDYKEVLPTVKMGRLPSRARSSLGKFCHDFECSDCGVELKKLGLCQQT